MRALLYTCFFLNALCLLGQVPLSTLSYQSLDDSVKVARIFKPQNIYQGDSESLDYDFSQVDYGCTYPLNISVKDKDLHLTSDLFSYMQREVKGNGHFIKSWSFDNIFGISKPVQCVFKKELAYIRFPAREGQGFDRSLEASISLSKENASGLFADILDKYQLDSAEFLLNVETNIEVDIQQKILFKYGERLAYPVITNFVFSLQKVRNVDTNQLIDISSFNNQNTVGEQITYIKIYNSYKGIWLATICKYEQNISFVDLISQPNFPFTKRFCQGLDASIQVYPNPNFGQMKLFSNLEEDGTYFFELYNIIGQRIWKTEYSLQTGIEVNEINIPNPKKGTYLYSVRNPKGDRLFTRRLTILEY